MKQGESHISDRELILAMDGELESRDAHRVGSHLEACWTCRARKQELERAISDFVRLHRRYSPLPPSDGTRAVLQARLAEIAASRPPAWWKPTSIAKSRWLVAFACLLLAAWIISERSVLRHWTPSVVFAAPNPTLTPGAAVLEGTHEVCREPKPKNKEVSSALRRRVFEEYGLAGDLDHAYEVDYLITPALGGADDIHNLWPHSYRNTEWNAKVKDALEDRLRELVCEGKVDLPTAQRDIATNWIEAYKKYFHTDHPIQAER